MNEREQVRQQAAESMNTLARFIASMDQARASLEALLEALRELRDSVEEE